MRSFYTMRTRGAQIPKDVWLTSQIEHFVKLEGFRARLSGGAQLVAESCTGIRRIAFLRSTFRVRTTLRFLLGIECCAVSLDSMKFAAVYFLFSLQSWAGAMGPARIPAAPPEHYLVVGGALLGIALILKSKR